MNAYRPRILLCAGEASGDRLAAELAGAIRELRGDVDLRGIAGPAMREAGVEPIARADDLAMMGYGAAATVIAVLRALRAAIAEMDAWRPDVVVTVDSPDSMLRLARAARRRGIPAVHWVSPQVWAWRAGRLPAIATAVDCMLCLFPMEPPLYEAHGLRAVFTGHPAARRMGAARVEPLGPPTTIALLPGSRRSEVRNLWPVMVDVARLVRERLGTCRFVVPVAPTVDPAWLHGLRFDRVDGVAAAGGASVALCCSGTATLELCVLATPMVVVYRTSRIDYAIGRRLVQLDHIALPNILAGRAVVPEHVQHLDPAAIARDLLALVGPAGDAQRRELAEVAASIGGHDAAHRAAVEVARWLA